MIVSIIVGVAAASLAWAWLLYTRAKLHSRRKYEEYAKAFYREMKPLISDDETPANVLRVMSFLNAKVVDPHASMTILTHVSRGKFLEPNATERTTLKNTHAFFARRTELKDSYYAALVFAVLAISYRGGLVTGWLLRFWMSAGTSSDDETVTGSEPRSEGVITRFLRRENREEFAEAC